MPRILAAFLPFDGRAHHAKVIADVRLAGRLDAGEDARGGHWGFQISGLWKRARTFPERAPRVKAGAGAQREAV